MTNDTNLMKYTFSLFVYLLALFVTGLSAQNNVGIGTSSPSNKLEVHGNLLVTALTVSTTNPPTVAQTKTMINNATVSYSSSDSTGRFFDPGGPGGDYFANITYSRSFINPEADGTSLQLIIESIDLGAGDSLIIRPHEFGSVLLAIGGPYNTPGTFVFNFFSLDVRFTSDNNINTLGAGFSILYKRLFPEPNPSEAQNFSGNTFYFDSGKGTLQCGAFTEAPIVGNYSLGVGFKNKSSGQHSVALGYHNFATGFRSVAIGAENLASGINALSMGFATEAAGPYSTAMGYSTDAKGNYSTSMGYFTDANGYSSVTIGIYNDPIVSPQSLITPTTPLFIVGNGDPGNISNAMVVRKDGHVGIGTNTPRTRLHITNGNTANFSDTSGYFVIGSVGQTNIVFDNDEILAREDGGSSDLYIQRSGGRVLIGQGNTGNLFDVNGTAGKSSGPMWSTLSDMRLKENIQPYSEGLKDVLKINPVWYQYNTLSGFDTKPQYVGVIAQELQKVAPYMVVTTDKVYSDGSSGYLQVDGSAMTYMLINAVKELDAENKSLKAEQIALDLALAKLTHLHDSEIMFLRNELESMKAQLQQVVSSMPNLDISKANR